jgi:hypothetical protein
VHRHIAIGGQDLTEFITRLNPDVLAGTWTLACRLTSGIPDQGFYHFVRRVAVRVCGLRVIICSRQRTHDHHEGRDEQLA